MELALLTTRDNPFNPHTQWDEWYAFDRRKGYHTCELLARVTNSADYIDDNSTEFAMAEIVKYHRVVDYVMVTRRNFNAVMQT